MELAGRGAWAVKPPADFLLPFAFRFTTERSFRMRIFSLLAGSRSGFFGAATAGAEASGALALALPSSSAGSSPSPSPGVAVVSPLSCTASFLFWSLSSAMVFLKSITSWSCGSWMTTGSDLTFWARDA